MPEQRMPQQTGKGTGEPGWTEQEKGPDASGRPAPDPDDAAGEAGEATAKGRPSDDRAKTESAAADTTREAQR